MTDTKTAVHLNLPYRRNTAIDPLVQTCGGGGEAAARVRSRAVPSPILPGRGGGQLASILHGLTCPQPPEDRLSPANNMIALTQQHKNVRYTVV
jgi:hypothetical protein